MTPRKLRPDQILQKPFAKNQPLLPSLLLIRLHPTKAKTFSTIRTSLSYPPLPSSLFSLHLRKLIKTLAAPSSRSVLSTLTVIHHRLIMMSKRTILLIFPILLFQYKAQRMFLLVFSQRVSLKIILLIGN
jgi:hypothetical protein